MEGRVTKAVLISSIPPTFMESAKKLDGVPKEVVGGIRNGTAFDRSQFYKDSRSPFMVSTVRESLFRKKFGRIGGGKE
jgi:non-heme chloroperoxidase